MTTLVLGATGTVGPHVVDALLAQRADVRVMARDVDAARQRLPSGVEIVAGDFTSEASVEAAMSGCDAVFLLTPHGPDMAEVQLALVDVAARLGVRVVKLSGTSAAVSADGPDAGAAHWRVEQALAESTVPYVILRPNAFMQGLLVGLATQATATGRIANPLGNAGLSFVDCADIGRAAAVALLDSRHDGATFVLTGPEAPTYADVAALLSDVLEREVAVVEVTPEDVAAGLRERGASEWGAEHLREMLSLFRESGSEYVTNHVVSLTAQAPTSPREFLVRQCRQLTSG